MVYGYEVFIITVMPYQNESCPRVMKEGKSKNAALILMKHSYFDRTLRYYVDKDG